MSIVNRLTANDFTELCAVLCPFCRAKLPDYDFNTSSSRAPFVHTIPGTDLTYECDARVLRAERREPVAYRMPPE